MLLQIFDPVDQIEYKWPMNSINLNLFMLIYITWDPIHFENIFRANLVESFQLQQT